MNTTIVAPRQCYVILPTEFDPGYGYVPCLVTENEPGYQSMRGDASRFQRPWYWGTTWEQAEAVCAKVNLDDFDITPGDAAAIALSSITVKG